MRLRLALALVALLSLGLALPSQAETPAAPSAASTGELVAPVDPGLEALLTPQGQLRAGCFSCYGPVFFSTAPGTATGSSCTAARTNLTNQLKATIGNSCIVNGYDAIAPCSLSLRETQVCGEISPGVFLAAGWLNYHCQINIC
ncbi:MAG TPA: hypothetical protein PK413_03085 [Thermoanaerobaculia bacterium]|nr:hypothetical protein [Thermoanaerobaculia bacterium]